MRLGRIDILDTEVPMRALCPWCGVGLPEAAGIIREDLAQAEALVSVLHENTGDEDAEPPSPDEFVHFALCVSCRRTWQGRALWVFNRLVAAPWRWAGRLLWRFKRGLLSFVGGDRYRTVPVAHTDLYCRRTARGETRHAGYFRQLFRAGFTCRRFRHLIDGTEMGSGGGEVDGWCARCDCNVLLSAADLRLLRGGGVAPEMFQLWDQLGIVPGRPRSVSRDGEDGNEPTPA